jgi:hypothetical protein
MYKYTYELFESHYMLLHLGRHPAQLRYIYYITTL